MKINFYDVLLFIKMPDTDEGAQWLSGRVLDLRPRVGCSSLTGITVLCPWARHILIKVLSLLSTGSTQEDPPDITEKLLTGT